MCIAEKAVIIKKNKDCKKLWSSPVSHQVCFLLQVVSPACYMEYMLVHWENYQVHSSVTLTIFFLYDFLQVQVELNNKDNDPNKLQSN